MKCQWCKRECAVGLRTVAFDSVDLYRNSRITIESEVCFQCEAAFKRGAFSVTHGQAMSKSMPKVWTAKEDE